VAVRKCSGNKNVNVSSDCDLQHIRVVVQTAERVHRTVCDHVDDALLVKEEGGVLGISADCEQQDHVSIMSS
jgi:hypothetical protein